MGRDIRGLALVAILIGLAVAVLVIPEVNIKAFGGEFKRGESQNVLGMTLGLDLQGGTHLVYKAVPKEGQTVTADDLEGVKRIIEKRVNEFGVGEPLVNTLGVDRIVIQLPGLTGASITSGISAGVITIDNLEALLRAEGNHPEATVERNDQGAFIMRFNELKPERLDATGAVVERSEADAIRELIERTFPTKISVEYVTTPPATPTPVIAPTADPLATPDAAATASPTPEATATPAATATATPEFKVPSLADIQAAAKSVREDAVVTETAVGTFDIVIAGLKDGGEDAEGNPTLSDDEKLRDALLAAGELDVLGAADRIGTWTVGGGVQEAKELIGSTAQLEFRERICGPDIKPVELVDVPDALWPTLRCSDPLYYTEQPAGIESGDLVDAFPGTQANIGTPIVTIVFNDVGAQAFFDVTDRISRTGDLLAIFLDGEELVAPSASQGISGGRAFIQGPDFTAERVRTIAIQLRSGALPVGLDLIQERNIDATLGKDSLEKTLVAGGVGLALLFAYVTLYYRVPGLVASVSLIIFTALSLAIFKLIPVTMTLAGAAGFILSLGWAVDANVLIAERTKEELRTGRTLMAALAEGFDRSWPSFRDGNIATIITAGVLFWFGDRLGTGLMQGFALTLGIGTLLSMFTSVTVSRILLRLVARTPVGKKQNLFVPVNDETAIEASAPAGGSK